MPARSRHSGPQLRVANRSVSKAFNRRAPAELACELSTQHRLLLLHRSTPLAEVIMALSPEQLRSQNRDLNDLQLKNYRGLLQNKSKGVKVESTK